MELETLVSAREVLMRTEYVALPFFVCLACLLLFHRIAPSIGIVDHPDARKDHQGLVPTVGGPAMLISVAVNFIILMPHVITAIFLALTAALVVLGMLDDRFDLPVSVRVAVQVSVAGLMFTYGGIQINELGNLFGLGDVNLVGISSLAFTTVCVLGVINAINMIDGLDGLAGSVLTISFAALAWLAWSAGDLLGARVLVVFVGALLAFLCFNARVFVRRAEVFMGDSGSMMMGFTLAWFLIAMTQGSMTDGSGAMSAVTAGWIFGLPLADTVAVALRRLAAGRSPLSAGRDHLHHMLRDAGLSVNGTVAVMAVTHAVLVGVGLLSDARKDLEPFMFMGFVLLVGLHLLVTPRLLRSRAERATRHAHASSDPDVAITRRS